MIIDLQILCASDHHSFCNALRFARQRGDQERPVVIALCKPMPSSGSRSSLLQAVWNLSEGCAMCKQPLPPRDINQGRCSTVCSTSSCPSGPSPSSDELESESDELGGSGEPGLSHSNGMCWNSLGASKLLPFNPGYSLLHQIRPSEILHTL